MQYTREEIEDILLPYNTEVDFKIGMDKVLGGAPYKTKRALINLIFLLWKRGTIDIRDVIDILWEAQKDGC